MAWGGMWGKQRTGCLKAVTLFGFVAPDNPNKMPSYPQRCVLLRAGGSLEAPGIEMGLVKVPREEGRGLHYLGARIDGLGYSRGLLSFTRHFLPLLSLKKVFIPLLSFSALFYVPRYYFLFQPLIKPINMIFL